MVRSTDTQTCSGSVNINGIDFVRRGALFPLLSAMGEDRQIIPFTLPTEQRRGVTFPAVQRRLLVGERWALMLN